MNKIISDFLRFRQLVFVGVTINNVIQETRRPFRKRVGCNKLKISLPRRRLIMNSLVRLRETLGDQMIGLVVQGKLHILGAQMGQVVDRLIIKRLSFGVGSRLNSHRSF